MAEGRPAPAAWVGQEAHLTYVVVDKARPLNCTIREVNAKGLCVAVGEGVSFFPWDKVVRIDLGHRDIPQSKTRVIR